MPKHYIAAALLCLLCLSVVKTAAEDCPAAEKPTLSINFNSNPTENKITVAWIKPANFPAVGYVDIKLRLNVAGKTPIFWVNSTNPPAVFSNLESDTEYEVISSFCTKPGCCNVEANTVKKVARTQLASTPNDIKQFLAQLAVPTAGTFDANSIQVLVAEKPSCSQYQINYCIGSSGCMTLTSLLIQEDPDPATVTKYTLTGLTDYTSYSIFVRCMCGDKKGPASDIFLQRTKPATDVNATLTSTMNSITITIPAKVRPEAPNPVYVVTAVDAGVKVDQRTATIFDVSNLMSARTYKFQVKWCADGKDIPASCADAVNVEKITAPDPSNGESATLDKAQPTPSAVIVKATATDKTGSADVTWTCPDQKSFEVRIDKCTGSPSTCKVFKTVPLDPVEDPKKTTITGLEDFTRYIIKVFATKKVGNAMVYGPPSKEIEYTTEGNALIGLKAAKSGSSNIELSWTPKNTNVIVRYYIKQLNPAPAPAAPAPPADPAAPAAPAAPADNSGAITTDNPSKILQGPFVAEQCYIFEVKACLLENSNVCTAAAKIGFCF